MPFSQDLIHKLEVGGGMRYVKIALAVLAVVGFTVAYNFRAFRNMSTQEAMDSAQLARNIAEGKGYKTLYVRPLSMYLLKRVNEKKGIASEGNKVPKARITVPELLAVSAYAQTSRPTSKAAEKTAQLFSDEVVAKGKGVEVKRSQLDAVVLPAGMPRDEKRLLQNLIRVQMLLGHTTEADRAKATEQFKKSLQNHKAETELTDAEFDAKLNLQLRAQSLSREQWEKQRIDQASLEVVLERETKVNVTEEEVKKFYDENPTRFDQQPEKIPGKKLEFAKVRDRIKETLTRAAIEEQLPDYFDKLTKEATIVILDGNLKLTGRETVVERVLEENDYSQIRTIFSTNIVSTGTGPVTNVIPNSATHPDIANPPVYPVVLAGLLKLPLNEDALTKKPFWSSDGDFYRYQPDFVISLFNQLLFFVLIAAVYFLARRLFDPTVALLSALLLFGTELFWRFAVSGLSTLLVMLMFTGLLWCLHFAEREGREPQWKPWAAFGLAALSGVLVGTGCLTRYAFGWLIVPLVAYLALFAGPRRWVLGLVALLSFVVVISPWVARNIHVSGMPFGTATFAALENTGIYPDNRLLRSLTPNFERVLTGPLWYKLMQNTRIALTTDAPRFSGNWVSAFFIVGLMMNFRSLAIRRLRYFILLCLPVLVVVQAMGRTTLSDEWPEVNSENLLVLLAPIVIVYGVSFFLVLLDQIELPLKGLRYLIMGVFGALVCLPMLLVFVTPRDSNTKVVAYPPYHPPMIQQIAGWMKKDELLMSDIPWAVAWYGRRQCVWLTLNTEKDYFSINDTQKQIRGLYLTPQTMDSKFLTQWVRAGERSWGNFILDTMLRREVPPWFPLRAAPSGFLPEQLFLADWERWRIGTEPAAPTVVAPAPKP